MTFGCFGFTHEKKKNRNDWQSTWTLLEDGMFLMLLSYLWSYRMLLMIITTMGVNIYTAPDCLVPDPQPSTLHRSCPWSFRPTLGWRYC